MKLYSLLLTLIAFALISAPVRGDIVNLKDGRKVEGDVVEKSEKKVVVQTKFGLAEFKMSEVLSIEKKAAPADEYNQRIADAGDDPEAIFKVYLWAKGRGLKSQPRKALRLIVKLEPDHDKARRLLGYEKYGERWVTEAEKKKLETAAEREEMEAKGLVLFKGEWVTPEDKERAENEARGLVEIEGEWVNKKEYEKRKKDLDAREARLANQAKGLFEVEGKWVPKSEAEAYYADLNNPYQTSGDLVNLYTTHGIDFGEKMLIGAEAACREARAVLDATPGGDNKKLHVFVVSNLEDYNRLGQGFNADEQSSNFYTFSSPWLPENEQGFDLVSSTYFYQAESLTEIYVKHATAEQFVRRVIGEQPDDPAPRWFIDAVAAYVSRYRASNLYDWSRERLLALGGVMKFSNYFKSYQPNEQFILGGGILMAWLKSSDCPGDVSAGFVEAVAAMKSGKKVSKAFADFEKTLIKNEDSFRDFAEM